jgi:hypothetical protein
MPDDVAQPVQVRTLEIDLRELPPLRSGGEGLLRLAYGPEYVGSMIASCGPRPLLIEAIEAGEHCAFAALCTASARVKAAWALRLLPLSVATAFDIVRSGTMIMDYTVVSPQRKGRWTRYFEECCRFLAGNGFRAIYSECQLLRQLDFLVARKYQMLNPPTFSPRERIEEVGRFVRTRSPSVAVAESPQVLHPGETLFFYDNHYFRPNQWNVFLARRTYIKVDLAPYRGRTS